MVEIPRELTIGWLRRAYATGAAAPRQVVEEIVRRAEESADYCVWVTPPSMELVEPFLATLSESGPTPEMPLWGVPFAVKDNIDIAGVPTTAGCPAYAYTPQTSATVVERLVAAGAIPVGKANLDQFATGLVGVRSPYGECRNALNPDLISGGSSSGSAVAVALGMAAFALDTDTAGSGRVPAALNRLMGFKPPLGSWSTAGVVPACASLDCVTVFAHSVEDVRAVDAVARGFDTACAYSRFYEETAQASCELPDAICLPSEQPAFYGDFAHVYKDSWDATVEALRVAAVERGIVVRAMDCSYLNEAAAVLYDGPWVAERWADLGSFVETHPGDVLPVTESILRSGAREELTAEVLFDAMHFLQECRHRAQLDLADAVLVMPTCGGTFARAQVDQDPVGANSQMGLYTNHCNLCDLAALALPGVEAADSLPFGITAFSLAGDQRYLMGFATDLAAHLE